MLEICRTRSYLREMESRRCSRYVELSELVPTCVRWRAQDANKLVHWQLPAGANPPRLETRETQETQESHETRETQEA